MNAEQATQVFRLGDVTRSRLTDAAAVAGLGRWLPAAAALVTAALYTAACPPYEWWFAAWAVPGLLLVPARRLRPWHALLCGVLFALTMSVGVASWVAHATLAYFNFNPVFAAAFALGVYLVYGAIPYGLLVLAYALLAPRVPAAARGALGACLWAGSELLRTNILTGLPWELLGHSQFRNLGLIQIADLGGVYAVSFVMALVSVSIAELLVDLPRQHGAGWIARRLSVAGAALAATVLYGMHARHLYAAPTTDGVRTVAVVQGNVANGFRWKREYFERTLQTYVDMTRAVAPAPDLIVWPENAVNFYVDHEPSLRAALGAAAAGAHGLLLGAPRLSTDGRAHNSAYLINSNGGIEATYDKRRLVPFAEYDPLPWFRRGASTQPVVYTAGNSAEPLRVADLSIGTVICYEVLFPHLVRDLVRHGAEVLVNLSNDSWLDRGDGVAPRQHFSMSIFRAVETRRSLVRASASGVSGFVSPTGEMYSLLPSDTAGTAVAAVSVRRGQTPYVRWGDSWILIGLAASVCSVRRRRVGRRA